MEILACFSACLQQASLVASGKVRMGHCGSRRTQKISSDSQKQHDKDAADTQREILRVKTEKD